MKIKIKLPLPFGKKKGEEKPSEEEEELEKIAEATTPVTIVGELAKYKIKPKLIFVGSGKGGSGKSLLSSNLVVVVSALSNNVVYGVDLDLDSYTLSHVLAPRNFYENLIKSLQSNEEYLNLASILRTGAVKTGSAIIPIIKATTVACSGIQIPVQYRLIPAYNFLTQKEQMVALRSLTPRLLLSGLQELVTYFRTRVEELKSKGKDAVVIFDGKQKSNIGIEYEPLYRLMVDQCDVFILLVEAPQLSFSEIISPYKHVMDKTIIVINRAEYTIKDKMMALIADAVDRNIPIFIMPNSPSDGDLVRSQYTAPALKGLMRPTAIYTAAIAYFLNLLDDTYINEYKCTAIYDLMKRYTNLFRSKR